MKKYIFLIFVFVLLSPISSIWGDNAINGELNTYLYSKINNGSFLYNEESLLLKYRADISDNLAAYASIDFRYQNYPDINSIYDLNDKGKIEPLEISLKEGYIDYFGFLFKNLDLRVGKQRIAWGTADKMNPTDNLNPEDLTYFFEFGEKIPTLSAKAIYYLNDNFSLQAVYLPYFVPVRFSENVFNYPVLVEETLVKEIKNNIATVLGITPTVSDIRGSIILPEEKTKNSMYAVKLAGKLFNFDFSLSYFKGFDDIPIINEVKVDASNLNSTTINYKMIFPKINVIGIDTSGEIFGIGIWGEVGCFIPEEIKAINYTTLNIPIVGKITTISTNSMLDKEPYFKYTIGGDYTFNDGTYLNTQFVHGFFMERGYYEEKAQDYFIARIERKFFEDKIKLGLNGLIEIKDLNKAKNFTDIRKKSANMWGFDTTYYPADSTEISSGVIVLQGAEDTFLGKIADNDQIYIKFKLYF